MVGDLEGKVCIFSSLGALMQSSIPSFLLNGRQSVSGWKYLKVMRKTVSFMLGGWVEVGNVNA